MNNLRKLLEEKKEKSSQRKARFGTRKLSIGLVSCVLGYVLFMSPAVVKAEKIEVAPTEIVSEANVETASILEEKVEDKKEAVVEDKKVEAKEVSRELSKEEVTEEVKAEAVTDEKVSSIEENTERAEVATPVEEKLEKREESTPVEEKAKKEATEEAITLSGPETAEGDKIVTDKDEEKTEENAKALKEGAEIVPEAVGAGNKVAVSDVNVTINGKQDASNNTINPLGDDDETNNENISLEAKINFKVPDATKKDDFFEVALSDNVNLHGISTVPFVEHLYYKGELIANAELDSTGRKIKYTFTDAVNKYKDVALTITTPLFIDKDNVPNNSDKETVSIDIDGKKNSKNFKVNYDHKDHDTIGNTETLSGVANIDNVTENEFTHTIYVNTNNQILNNSKLSIENQPIKEGEEYGVDFDNEEVRNSVKVYKVKDRTKLSKSFRIDESNLEDVTENATVSSESTFGPSLKVDINQNNDNSTYIVKYVGKRNPKTAAKTVVKFGAGNKITTDGSNKGPTEVGNWAYKNEIDLFTGSTDTTGTEEPENPPVEEKEGSFTEHHIYEVYVDGVKQDDQTTTIDIEKTTGKESEEYTTSAKPTGTETDKKEGFTLVEGSIKKSEEITKEITGAETTGNYIADKNLEVTYVYRKDITSPKGSFQEHHIYQTVDEDGNVISTDETVDVDATEGKASETYTTSKQDKEGYELVEVKPTNDKSKELGVKFDAKGAETTGNYVKNEKQEVTYVYQKKVTTKGSFQEHHVYQTVDEDGNVISTDETVDKDVTEGKASETYTTSKQDKEGYELVRVENPVEDPTYNQDGSVANGNYKPGKKQEITYVYQKKQKKENPPTPVVEEKGSFIEHHIYITKDKDGKEIKREVVDEPKQEGKKEETYTTGKKDKEGFTLVRTENPKENPSYNEKGVVTTGNFVPGKTQEITYVYEKTEEPVKPTEPTEPTKPTEPVEPPTPYVPVKPTEPVTPPVPEKPTEEVKEEPIKTVEPKEEIPNAPVEEEKKEEVKEEKEVKEEVKEEPKEEIKEEAPTFPVEESNPEPKAPKTNDPGVLGFLGLGGFAASVLAFIDSKKRKRK